MSIEQARVIVHNAYVGSQIKPPKPPAKTGSQRALEAELTDAGGLDVAGGIAQGIGELSNSVSLNNDGKRFANEALKGEQKEKSIFQLSNVALADGFWVAVIAVVVIGLGGIYLSGQRRHGVSSDGCVLTLRECFDGYSRKDFYPGQVVSTDEFAQLLYAINDDLHERWIVTPLDLARVDYDTPFFTGNATCRDCPEKDEHPDNIVCIEEITCSPQSAINYVAQGMYSARAGQSLEMIFAIADEWNFILYGHDATEEEKYWIKFGFNFYLDLNP